MNEQTKPLLERTPLLPVSRLLVDAWRLYALKLTDFIEMYIWGLIGAVPLLFLGILALISFYWLHLNSWPVYILFGLLGLASVAWAIYYGTRAKIGLILVLKNENVKVKESFQASKRFFASYFVVSIVTSIIIGFAFLLLIIPGIILSVTWSMAILLTVLEDKSTIKSATRRSRELIKGYWWPVFGRFLAIGVVAVLVSVIMNIPMNSLNEAGKQAYSFIINVFWALISPLFLTYSYLLYKDLVSKK